MPMFYLKCRACGVLVSSEIPSLQIESHISYLMTTLFRRKYVIFDAYQPFSQPGVVILYVLNLPNNNGWV